MHRLNAPMATDRFGETFAAQISAEDVIADVTAFCAVRVLCHAQGEADGLHPGPLLFQRKISRNLTEEVRSFVNPAMRLIERVILSIAQFLQVALQILFEVSIQRFFEALVGYLSPRSQSRRRP